MCEEEREMWMAKFRLWLVLNNKKEKDIMSCRSLGMYAKCESRDRFEFCPIDPLVLSAVGWNGSRWCIEWVKYV